MLPATQNVNHLCRSPPVWPESSSLISARWPADWQQMAGSVQPSHQLLLLQLHWVSEILNTRADVREMSTPVMCSLVHAELDIFLCNVSVLFSCFSLFWIRELYYCLALTVYDDWNCLYALFMVRFALFCFYIWLIQQEKSGGSFFFFF